MHFSEQYFSNLVLNRFSASSSGNFQKKHNCHIRVRNPDEVIKMGVEGLDTRKELDYLHIHHDIPAVLFVFISRCVGPFNHSFDRTVLFVGV